MIALTAHHGHKAHTRAASSSCSRRDMYKRGRDSQSRRWFSGLCCFVKRYTYVVHLARSSVHAACDGKWATHCLTSISPQGPRKATRIKHAVRIAWKNLGDRAEYEDDGREGKRVTEGQRDSDRCVKMKTHFANTLHPTWMLWPCAQHRS